VVEQQQTDEGACWHANHDATNLYDNDSSCVSHGCPKYELNQTNYLRGQFKSALHSIK
jgi:hypothetical protein